MALLGLTYTSSSQYDNHVVNPPPPKKKEEDKIDINYGYFGHQFIKHDFVSVNP